MALYCFKVVRLVLCFLCVLHPVWADDTEIFFNSTVTEGVRPNLLFALDASDSMPWFDCLDGSISKKYSCPDNTLNGNITRLNRMNAAVRDVIDNASGVNVGIMRFGGIDGGRIIYPVTDIDANACPGSVCDENTVFEAQAAVQIPEDDVVQNDAGSVFTYQKKLWLGDNAASNKIAAMRFSDLNIPQGATIQEAKLVLTSGANAATPTGFTVQIEDVADAEPFVRNGNYTVGDRNWHTETVAWNSLPAWTTDTTYQSPDLSSLLQLVVSRSDWCGGNAVSLSLNGVGSRVMYGFEHGNSKGAVLRVRFSLAGIPAGGGCAVKSTTFALDRAEGDSYQVQSGAVKDDSNKIPIDDGVLAGVQFSEVRIPQGATVRKAYIEFKSFATGGGGSLRANISMEDSTDPASFSTTHNNLGSRTKLAGLDWAVPLMNRNLPIRTRDLSPLVNQIVSSAGWEEGRRMSFFFEKSAGNDADNRKMYDFNNARKRAALLTINTEISARTALEFAGDTRSKIKQELDDILTIIGTPTVGALEEVQRYFKGLPVEHGKHRADNSQYNTLDDERSRVSHTGSYTNGTQEREIHCLDSRPNSPECDGDIVTGSPVYQSPAEFECQPNYMVLLSDGEPWIGNNASFSSNTDYHNTIAYIEGLHGEQCIETLNPAGLCGPEITKYMYENDMSALQGMQNVITHAIGFNIKADWIKELSTAGGGNYYEAESSSELLDALTDIVTSVVEGSTTFVAPAVTVDQTTRLSHRNDVYLALFEPAATDNWNGNLKKYKFDGAILKDKLSQRAVDAATGQFLPEAHSFWTRDADGADGAVVTLGGARSLLSPVYRNIVSYMDAGTKKLFSLENRITISNQLITPAKLAVEDEDELELILDWLTGFDVKDADKNGITNEARKYIGDPLHTNPVVVTYGLSDPDTPDSVVIFGTNEGFLHAIDTQDGTEDFGFMPPELLANVPMLFKERRTGRVGNRPYGMDGGLTLWTIDNNGDGAIEADDKAYLYAGMRRGGRNYYALDLSKRADPKFMWSIIGGMGDFKELGQTWSKPTLAKIKIGDTTPQQILVFAGGYDPAQDDKTQRGADTIGRSLYFVDALTGALIWSGSPGDFIPTSGHHNTFDDMNYSIPSNLQIINDEYGLLSQIYVGDMGGNIWRFDINNGSAIDSLVNGGVIAEFGEDDTDTGARRFYSAPDIALAAVARERFLHVSIGSGYRAHPLDTAIEDKFFSFRYPYDAHDPSEYGLEDKSTGVYAPIELTDLYDATANLIGQGTKKEIKDAKEHLAGKQGWYIDMEGNGEKVLGKSNTLNYIIRFVSYEPQQNTDSCEPNIGHSNYWAVNLRDGTPVEDESDGESDKVKEDRKKPIPGGGISPPVTTMFVEKDGTVTPIDTSGQNVLREWGDLDLMKRMYWSEQPQ